MLYILSLHNIIKYDQYSFSLIMDNIESKRNCEVILTDHFNYIFLKNSVLMIKKECLEVLLKILV